MLLSQGIYVLGPLQSICLSSLQKRLHNPVAFSKSLATAYRNTLMLTGYARVSKLDQQDTRAQDRALKEVGCKRIFRRKRFWW